MAPRAPARSAWRSHAALTFIVVACLTSFARAAPSQAEREARRAFQTAESHFRAGRFADALVEYQSGYEKAPLPGFLINIAQCQRRLGDLRKARATYQKFVIVAPDSPHVAEVRGLIGELEKVIAELDDKKVKGVVSSGERPEPSSETKPIPAADASPAPETVLASAAREAVSLLPLRTSSSAVSPALPQTSSEAAILVATREPTAAAARPPHRSRWWLWTAIGVAVAGGTATAFVLTRSPPMTTLHEGTLGTLRR